MGIPLTTRTPLPRPDAAWLTFLRRYFFYPKTMTSLIACSCLLAALPILVALGLAGLSLDRVTQRTEALIDEGITVAQLAADLDVQLKEIERSVRQYRVLRDADLRDLAEKRWESTLNTAQLLASQPLDGALAGQVTQLRQELSDARDSWRSDGGTSDEAPTRLHQLGDAVDDIIAAARKRTEVRLDALRGATLHARRDMLISALTLIPLAIVLALACSVAATRPLRKIHRTIAALGHGRAVPAVDIRFPREMHRLAEQLEWLRCRLADLEEDKDRFLRQVSHELKTPLASLREGTELLGDGALGALNPRQTEVNGILSEATGELETLIHNLLTYAEWRQGRKNAEHEWFEAKALFDEVLSKHSLSMTKRSVYVLLDVECENLYGQRSQIRVAVDNLFTNALKHAPPNTAIEITAVWQSMHCAIDVRDRGRGIADADKQRIFEPFVRGSETNEQRVRGTGIGLSIVKEVISAHGGIVSVEDAHPGARFRLVWPHPRP